jgi:predicted nucleic acid-binding protein
MTTEPTRRRVVSNTTPVSNFLRIGRLGLLGEIFGEITIPIQVAEELAQGEHVLGRWRDAPGAECFAVLVPTDGPFLRQLELQLDSGEAGAIALAVEHGALLLMDEIAGRKVAAHHRLPLTGTLGIVAEAKRAGLVPAVRPLLDALAREGYHVSRALRARVLEDAGESD